LARFNALALGIIHALWSERWLFGDQGTVISIPCFDDTDVTTADYRNLLHPADHDAFRRRLDVSNAGSIPVYAHAAPLLRALGNTGGEVWVVTSPMHGNERWCYDRLRWLHAVLGVDRHRVAIMSDKSAFDGAVLIDDLARNLHQFEDGGNGRRGILWRQPYSEDGCPWNGWWVNTVEGAEQAVRAALDPRQYQLGRA
jgi:hypothetical protein